MQEMMLLALVYALASFEQLDQYLFKRETPLE